MNSQSCIFLNMCDLIKNYYNDNKTINHIIVILLWYQNSNINKIPIKVEINIWMIFLGASRHLNKHISCVSIFSTSQLIGQTRIYKSWDRLVKSHHFVLVTWGMFTLCDETQWQNCYRNKNNIDCNFHDSFQQDPKLNIQPAQLEPKVSGPYKLHFNNVTDNHITITTTSKKKKVWEYYAHVLIICVAEKQSMIIN